MNVTPRSRLSFAVSFFLAAFFTTLAAVLTAWTDTAIDVESGSCSDCSVLALGCGGTIASWRAARAAIASCSEKTKIS